jgi:hypothetical protein
MATSRSKHKRIHAACRELEKALQNFEDDTEAKMIAEREAKKIKEIKIRLNEIKKQLDQLSS